MPSHWTLRFIRPSCYPLRASGRVGAATIPRFLGQPRNELWGTSVGIQLRFGAHTTKIYNNTVVAHAGVCPATFATQTGSNCEGEGEGIKVIGGTYAVGNLVYNNTVKAVSNSSSPDLWAIGLYGDGVSDGSNIFSSNTVTSDTILADCNGDDGGGSNFKFISNTFIRGPNPQGFHSIRLIAWANATGNTFLDNNWQGGATSNDLTATTGGGGFNYGYTSQFYLSVTAQDSGGNPLSGVNVSAVATGGGTETVSGITDGSGHVRLTLTQFSCVGQTSSGAAYTNYTPHSVTASRSGYPAATADVTMGSSKSITMVLSGCTSASQCDDGNPCTTDTCASNLCQHPAITGCCTSASQCDDGNPCTTDTCASNLCQHPAIAGCCTSASQCDDGSRCTTDMCVSNACQHTSLSGCCATDADCADNNPCTADTCDLGTGTCRNRAAPGCCIADTECDDGDPCTADHCELASNSCSHIPGSCTLDGGTSLGGRGGWRDGRRRSVGQPTRGEHRSHLCRERMRVCGSLGGGSPLGLYAVALWIAMVRRRS